MKLTKKMDLTINQIKEKQIELENNLEKLLNDFYEETGVHMKGRINFVHRDSKLVQYVLIDYMNPF